MNFVQFTFEEWVYISSMIMDFMEKFHVTPDNIEDYSLRLYNPDSEGKIKIDFGKRNISAFAN